MILGYDEYVVQEIVWAAWIKPAGAPPPVWRDFRYPRAESIYFPDWESHFSLRSSTL